MTDHNKMVDALEFQLTGVAPTLKYDSFEELLRDMGAVWDYLLRKHEYIGPIQVMVYPGAPKNQIWLVAGDKVLMKIDNSGMPQYDPEDLKQHE